MLRDVYGRARSIGLLGPGPIDDHLRHALRFVRAAGTAPTRLIDLGSGAGVPGLFLASVWPDSRVVLLDAMAKRATFLRWATEQLQLGGRVEVVEGRAEELARSPRLRAAFDCATARGFGPPAVTAECAAGFLEPGGRLIVSEPPEELDRWPVGGLAEVGMERAPCPEPLMAVMRQVVLASDRFPRRVGVPRKRPLF